MPERGRTGSKAMVQRQQRSLEEEAEQPAVAAELSGGLERNQVTGGGKGRACCCSARSRPGFVLYLVLDLNFFPKALSSSGTDNVRVKEPSDSDLTTRASRKR